MDQKETLTNTLLQFWICCFFSTGVPPMQMLAKPPFLVKPLRGQVRQLEHSPKQGNTPCFFCNSNWAANSNCQVFFSYLQMYCRVLLLWPFQKLSQVSWFNSFGWFKWGQYTTCTFGLLNCFKFTTSTTNCGKLLQCPHEGYFCPLRVCCFGQPWSLWALRSLNKMLLV